MHIRAPAKINLSLEILGARKDGYHDLISVMQTVSLADDLEFQRASGIELQAALPFPVQENLIYCAAKALRDHFGVERGCRCRLEKRIPVAAGLGGGSSDAAATLRALSQLWDLDAPDAALCSIAAQLGSDVPFFLSGGTALIEGRGEKVTTLPEPERTWYLLVTPAFAVSTARVFAAVIPADFSDGSVTRAVAGHIVENGTTAFGRNDLQPVLMRMYPEVQPWYDIVASVAPGRTIVSGSGPTIVAQFASRGEAESCRTQVSMLGCWTAVVSGGKEERSCVR